ncbi:MAG TPA: NAD-dependent epimerase/dehydratase family protein [Ignavibacteria bacterium]|nr:NAD-dependent epimerase/dehydratase family protein [Ignavibacteria bacterium]
MVNKKNILVIGGTAFIGIPVVKYLNDNGHNVTLLNRGNRVQNIPKGVKHITGDRNEIDKLKSEIENVKPDVIIDMACIFEAQAKLLVETVKDITSKIVMVSSCDVYEVYGRLIGTEPGDLLPTPVTEKDSLRKKLYPYRNPENPSRMDDYDKITVEKTVMESGLNWSILRLPMVYGTNDYQYRFYKYLKRMEDKRPFILLSHYESQFKGCRGYVEDIGYGIYLSAISENANNQIFNIGEENTVTEKNWVKKIAKYAGWNGEIVVLPPKEDEKPMQNLDTDTKKIRELIGYTELTPENIAYHKTIEWEKNNPPKNFAEPFNYEEEDKIYSELALN